MCDIWRQKDGSHRDRPQAKRWASAGERRSRRRLQGWRGRRWKASTGVRCGTGGVQVGAVVVRRVPGAGVAFVVGRRRKDCGRRRRRAGRGWALAQQLPEADGRRESAVCGCGEAMRRRSRRPVALPTLCGSRGGMLPRVAGAGARSGSGGARGRWARRGCPRPARFPAALRLRTAARPARGGARSLLDAQVEWTQGGLPYERYDPGTSYSLGLKAGTR